MMCIMYCTVSVQSDIALEGIYQPLSLPSEQMLFVCASVKWLAFAHMMTGKHFLICINVFQSHWVKLNQRLASKKKHVEKTCKEI